VLVLVLASTGSAHAIDILFGQVGHLSILNVEERERCSFVSTRVRDFGAFDPPVSKLTTSLSRETRDEDRDDIASQAALFESAGRDGDVAYSSTISNETCLFRRGVMIHASHYPTAFDPSK
jgi:hypothetical protein